MTLVIVRVPKNCAASPLFSQQAPCVRQCHCALMKCCPCAKQLMRSHASRCIQSLASRPALRDATSPSLMPPLARVRCGAEPTAFMYLRGVRVQGPGSKVSVRVRAGGVYTCFRQSECEGRDMRLRSDGRAFARV